MTSTVPVHVLVPPQSGRAVPVGRGSLIRITDPQGQQVADTWALTDSDGLEWLSTGQTRTYTGRLFPVAGESFFSDRARPILTLIEDGSPGPHDMLYPPCDPAMYAAVGQMNHPNCKENFEAALAAVGLALPFVPDPVNLFQNSLPASDRTLDVEASINPPGGYVVLRAERDLTLVVTACSMDVYPPYLTNGGVCTEILIDVNPSD